jgi:hypothetical protein
LLAIYEFTVELVEHEDRADPGFGHDWDNEATLFCELLFPRSCDFTCAGRDDYPIVRRTIWIAILAVPS